MNRSEFESMDSGSQKRYAKQEYSRISHQLIEEYHENGIYMCQVCLKNPGSHFHHLWERSHCGLWWTFQPENLLFVGYCCHPGLIHDTPHKLHPVARQMITDRRNKVIEMDNEKR